MIKGGINQFEGKNVLLLQGPIGPFFSRLSHDLKVAGANVFKINFNGGDWLFYRKNATRFNRHPNEWASFFYAFVLQNNIDVVLLFGDCRPIHQQAHEIASRLKLEIGVFEEGYIRPDYVTLERYGVNAHSKISKFADFYLNLPDQPIFNTHRIGQSFWYTAMWGMLYYAASALMRPYFRHYQHHRSLSIWQGLFWIRSMGRKWLYALQQRHMLQWLVSKHDKNYFLVPLQVHNDAQLHHHSDFFSIDAFISMVINSFAEHAPKECQLVIKHHPLDRGFHNYKKLINTICNTESLKNRVHYVHDLHLPTLLDHSKGVVVINSTVGLSGIIHMCPVINCGNALYDIEGLTYQGGLDTFWKESLLHKPDENLLNKFLSHLINCSQINGNFYKRLKKSGHRSGIRWNYNKPD